MWMILDKLDYCHCLVVASETLNDKLMPTESGAGRVIEEAPVNFPERT
jgi:hypothetical protein